MTSLSLARNPCLLFLMRRDGWNVLFTRVTKSVRREGRGRGEREVREEGEGKEERVEVGEKEGREGKGKGRGEGEGRGTVRVEKRERERERDDRSMAEKEKEGGGFGREEGEAGEGGGKRGLKELVRVKGNRGLGLTRNEKGQTSSTQNPRPRADSRRSSPSHPRAERFL